MKLTRVGSDYIEVNELTDVQIYSSIPKVHLIKLEFENPTEDKVEWVMKHFPGTKRFVVSDNIRIYNSVLKKTSKKFYVENRVGDPVVSFFRKNNKVLLNFLNLGRHEKEFLSQPFNFSDVLRNVEVIRLDSDTFEARRLLIEEWRGNVIVESSSDNTLLE